MEASSNDVQISLLAIKEAENKQLALYVKQLEQTYNELCDRFNALQQLHFRKEKKRKQIGFKQGGQNGNRGKSN